MLESIFILLWTVVKIFAILIPLLVAVAYLTLAERRIIGFIQGRYGPNRAGWGGVLQPFADFIKLLNKEIIVPSAANKYLYLTAPVLTFTPALVAWAVVPFDQGLVLANINAGVLFLFALGSLSVYGILIAGWASNSKYAFLGGLRSTAQTISYEIAMGFSLVGVLLAANSMNLQEIVLAQQGGVWRWFWLPLFPLFLTFWITGVAETNRAPFDVAEGESEIVAGFHVEYAGMAFAIFFLAEYANMILISVMVSIFFLGGWLSPFQGIPVLESFFAWVPGIFWLMGKAVFFLFLYLWLRATLPRYRYDQIMRLGWKVLIPVTLIWIIVTAGAIMLQLPPWFSRYS